MWSSVLTVKRYGGLVSSVERKCHSGIMSPSNYISSIITLIHKGELYEQRCYFFTLLLSSLIYLSWKFCVFPFVFLCLSLLSSCSALDQLLPVMVPPPPRIRARVLWMGVVVCDFSMFLMTCSSKHPVSQNAGADHGIKRISGCISWLRCVLYFTLGLFR